MPVRHLLTLLAVIMLSGCVVGQSVDMTHDATSAPKLGNSATVNVDVTDSRPYVTKGDKKPNFIGTYRSGFGIPYDVSTDGKEPLADIVQQDLIKELDALGYEAGVGTKSNKTLKVTIDHWKYDSYQNGTFEYDIALEVRNARGESMLSTSIEEVAKIKGTFWSGGKGGFEREMPRLYRKIIEAIARNNDDIISALNAR